MGDKVDENLNVYEIWQQLENLKCTDSAITVDKPICKCGSDTWDSVGDELYCCKCFTVLFKNLDSQAEWRFYGASDGKSHDPSRCGMPANQYTPTAAMGTIIGVNDTSSSHSHDNFFEYNKMRKYHLWNSMPYRERSLYNILNNINIQAGSNGITQTIIDDAKLMYSKLASDRITRGNNRSGLIASSIYMSCKSNNVPRSAKEVAKMFNLNITTMTKGCKHFNEIMKDAKFECSKPSDFIRRFLSKLKRMNFYDICMHVENKTNEFSLVTENAPPSIAAAIIFLVAVEQKDKDLTKKTIAKVCEISEVTINKVYKKLADFVEFILP